MISTNTDHFHHKPNEYAFIQCQTLDNSAEFRKVTALMQNADMRHVESESSYVLQETVSVDIMDETQLKMKLMVSLYQQLKEHTVALISLTDQLQSKLRKIEGALTVIYKDTRDQAERQNAESVYYELLKNPLDAAPLFVALIENPPNPQVLQLAESLLFKNQRKKGSNSILNSIEEPQRQHLHVRLLNSLTHTPSKVIASIVGQYAVDQVIRIQIDMKDKQSSFQSVLPGFAEFVVQAIQQGHCKIAFQLLIPVTVYSYEEVTKAYGLDILNLLQQNMQDPRCFIEVIACFSNVIVANTQLISPELAEQIRAQIMENFVQTLQDEPECAVVEALTSLYDGAEPSSEELSAMMAMVGEVISSDLEEKLKAKMINLATAAFEKAKSLNTEDVARFCITKVVGLLHDSRPDEQWMEDVTDEQKINPTYDAAYMFIGAVMTQLGNGFALEMINEVQSCFDKSVLLDLVLVENETLTSAQGFTEQLVNVFFECSLGDHRYQYAGMSLLQEATAQNCIVDKEQLPKVLEIIHRQILHNGMHKMKRQAAITLVNVVSNTTQAQVRDSCVRMSECAIHLIQCDNFLKAQGCAIVSIMIRAISKADVIQISNDIKGLIESELTQLAQNVTETMSSDNTELLGRLIECITHCNVRSQTVFRANDLILMLVNILKISVEHRLDSLIYYALTGLERISCRCSFQPIIVELSLIISQILSLAAILEFPEMDDRDSQYDITGQTYKSLILLNLSYILKQQGLEFVNIGRQLEHAISNAYVFDQDALMRRTLCQLNVIYAMDDEALRLNVQPILFTITYQLTIGTMTYHDFGLDNLTLLAENLADVIYYVIHRDLKLYCDDLIATIRIVFDHAVAQQDILRLRRTSMEEGEQEVQHQIDNGSVGQCLDAVAFFYERLAEAAGEDALKYLIDFVGENGIEITENEDEQQQVFTKVQILGAAVKYCKYQPPDDCLRTIFEQLTPDSPLRHAVSVSLFYNSLAVSRPNLAKQIPMADLIGGQIELTRGLSNQSLTWSYYFNVSIGLSQMLAGGQLVVPEAETEEQAAYVINLFEGTGAIALIADMLRRPESCVAFSERRVLEKLRGLMQDEEIDEL